MTERDSIDAAEFVAGLLDAARQAEVERRIQSDPSFARLVQQWRERLSDLDRTAPAIAHDPALWQRIEGEIGRPAASTPQQGVVSRLWNSIGALRATAAASLACALLFAVIAVGAVQYAARESARKPVYVAILVNDDTKQPGAVVNAFADGRAEMIPLADINVPPGRALQIWTLWDRNVGPRSVGLIDRARTVRLNLDDLPATGANQLFEITLEPAGGSPTGRPTGPILYKGTTSQPL